MDAVDLDDLNLADQGVTTLRVTSGGHVGAGNIRVAQLGTGQGTIDIRGGSTLQSRTLDVGYGGSGTMTVAEQGGVDTSDEASVGRNHGSQGHVVVDGVASRWTSGNLYVGGNDAFAGGTARLDVLNGGTVDVTDTLIIWDDATVQLEGSTLRARNIDHRHGGEFEFNSGRLEVADFNGELFNSGGMLAAGPGIAITRVRDDYFQFDGALWSAVAWHRFWLFFGDLLAIFARFPSAQARKEISPSFGFRSGLPA